MNAANWKKTSRALIARLALALGIVSVLCAANWTLKVAAEKFLSGKGTIRLAGDFLVLFFAKNTGAFLSLGRELEGLMRSLFLIWMPAALVAVLIGYAVRPAYKVGRARFLAAAIVAAGGVSNIAERVLYGFVVDYLNAGIGPGPFRTGVLNFADLEITVGIILFVLLKDGPKEAGTKAAAAETKEE